MCAVAWHPTEHMVAMGWYGDQAGFPVVVCSADDAGDGGSDASKASGMDSFSMGGAGARLTTPLLGGASGNGLVPRLNLGQD